MYNRLTMDTTPTDNPLNDIKIETFSEEQKQEILKEFHDLQTQTQNWLAKVNQQAQLWEAPKTVPKMGKKELARQAKKNKRKELEPDVKAGITKP